MGGHRHRRPPRYRRGADAATADIREGHQPGRGPVRRRRDDRSGRGHSTAGHSQSISFAASYSINFRQGARGGAALSVRGHRPGRSCISLLGETRASTCGSTRTGWRAASWALGDVLQPHQTRPNSTGTSNGRSRRRQDHQGDLTSGNFLEQMLMITKMIRSWRNQDASGARPDEGRARAGRRPAARPGATIIRGMTPAERRTEDHQRFPTAASPNGIRCHG